MRVATIKNMVSKGDAKNRKASLHYTPRVLVMARYSTWIASCLCTRSSFWTSSRLELFRTLVFDSYGSVCVPSMLGIVIAQRSVHC